MQLVADAPLLPASDNMSWAEDYWVGRVLREAGIKPVGHPGWTYDPHGHYVTLPLPRKAVVGHSVTPGRYAEMVREYLTLPQATGERCSGPAPPSRLT